MTASPTRTWTTCATCEGLALVSEDWNQVNHPACKRATLSDLAQRYPAAVEADDTIEADRLQAALDNIDRTDRERSLRNTAYWYARRGWPVFPLRPGSKRPLTEHGVKDASTDLDQITRWWAGTPAANIGIAAGVMFDALDVDWLDKDGKPSGAAQSWPQLRHSGAFPDIHGVAITPRSGLHLFVTPRGWPNRVKARAGLDIRGLGGYLVAPPSRLADGTMWKWVSPPSPRICGRPDYPNGAPTTGGDDDPPMREQDPVYDPDTGRQMNIWRITGDFLDETWHPTQWWQKPYRGRRP